MKIGVPKEIKPQESRVGLVPSSVRELVKCGHRVIVQSQAGADIGIQDSDYHHAGAVITKDPVTIYAESDLIIKVKEPQPEECHLLHEGQTLFAFLHLAPDRELTSALIASRCTAIAYETVTQNDGGLPLLTPMSQVAGRMSIQAGAHALEKASGGSGILLSGVPGVEPARVLVIGAGVVGSNAIRIAVGMEARVTAIDISMRKLHELDSLFGSKITTMSATSDLIEKLAESADLVIGAALIPGATTPKLLSRQILKRMRPGSVLVDVSIDQGGCFETSRPTTHHDPIFIEDNIVHYCVTNMPGAVPRTSTFALNNATLPFVLQLANKGIKPALFDDPHFLQGLNVHRGFLTHPAIAKAQGLTYIDPKEALA